MMALIVIWMEQTDRALHLSYFDHRVTDLTIDAGFYKCVPIGDLVWYDINKNDVWDNNENGINGLKVNLWRNNFGVWTIVDFKYTGQKPGSPSDDGYFMFCAPPGEYYIEVVMPPLGLVRSRPNIGTNEENDSDITSNGKTEVFIALSGSTKMDIGAGFYPMAVAGNLVWRDDNINGRQEANEPRVKGVKVEAIEMITGKVAGTAYTDDQGLYSLDYLEKEQYYIKFTPPAGFGATVPRAYSDDLDSDVDHSYGPYTTRAFSFESGMVNENIDLGLAYGVLPVDWLDVNVHRVSNKHIISWSTAREANVSHYEVERKLDGEKDFNPIPGIVAAKGNSNQISSYNHPDLDVDKPGSYVYRVKQIDFDGLFAYSKLVKVVVSAENSIEIYPNPAKNETNIQVSVSSDATVMIELFDGISKLVRVLKKSDVQVTGSVIYNMNLSDIPAGVYNVAITVDGVTTQKKLIRIE
ncbi:MAG: T9SS type A sorting domain-containing protein [Saprospiraceae bacterium]|nr:T9SS type A sorting domain-containing protein [Saprospiraceae bacterium]